MRFLTILVVLVLGLGCKRIGETPTEAPPEADVVDMVPVPAVDMVPVPAVDVVPDVVPVAEDVVPVPAVDATVPTEGSGSEGR